MAISHVIGSMYYAVSLPKVYPHLSLTTGILSGGIFDNDPSNDFCIKYFNQSEYCCSPKEKKTRVNSNDCNMMWKNNFALNGGINPLTGKPFIALMEHELPTLQGTIAFPKNTIPTAAETEILTRLQFDNLDDGQLAIKFCGAAFGILANQKLDQADPRVQNCIMDAQLIFNGVIVTPKNAYSVQDNMYVMYSTDDPVIDNFNITAFGLGGLIASSNAESARANKDMAVQIGIKVVYYLTYMLGLPIPETHHDSGLSSGAIAGIVIASLVCIIGFAVAGYYVC